MQCKCGGETRPSTHIVKTLKGAREWDDSCEETDLPIRIDQDKCAGCGRVEWIAWRNAK